MRFLILLCNLVWLSNTVYAQKSTHNYTLTGTINADIGTINLLTSLRPKQAQ